MLVEMQKRPVSPSGEAVSMALVNEYHLYELAVAIHPLTTVSNETKYSDIWYDWWNARNLLATTFSHRRPLSFCRPAADQLFAAINAFVPEKWEDAVAKYPPNPGADDPLIGYLSYSVREAAKEFETLLAAELQKMDTYSVTQKCLHNTSDLIERAHIALPTSTISIVPPQTLVDFDQAGKCIAFEIPTAAAFHLLRGTEAVIRKYYEYATGKAPKTKMRSWGLYLLGLKKHRADKRVTNIIEHIKEIYRDPVSHPEANLETEDAEVLFGLCISAIVEMVGQIKKLSAKGGTLQFPVVAGPAATGTENI